MSKKRDDTCRLYDEIYKNASMGAGTTAHLLSGKRSKEMNESLQKQYAEYTAICKNAQVCMHAHGKEIKKLTAFEKIRTDGGVRMNLLIDDSDSHIAKMLMNGGTMGVINAQKNLTKYSGAEKEAKALMKRLSDYELSTIDVMRTFL